MKCQKCGRDEVNFFYSSNVNGAVAETHLCSECAKGAGYDINSMFDSDMLGFGNMLDEFIPLFGRGGSLPGAMPRLASQLSMNYPYVARIPVSPPMAQNVKCGCEGAESAHCDAKTDGEMTERRRLNMEMRAAVEREDFEKAAELRDKIREIES